MYSVAQVSKESDPSRQNPLQITPQNREHVWQAQRLETHRNALRQVPRTFPVSHYSGFYRVVLAMSPDPKHLQRYVKEFEYRFNRRMRPETMLSELLSRFPELDA